MAPPVVKHYAASLKRYVNDRHKGKQPLHLRSLGVLARCFSVTLRHRNTVQVPFRILVQAADADLAYALTFQDASKA
jgi:hypothetical protein